ncbi:hypothetical protein B0H14DRAFT_3870752 [Mycena olivaceomarginata]|nr:hypothetical protein B0H14DRAFT_3870752 [Mycena olivaceomarginata]
MIISQGKGAPQAHPDNVRKDHAGRVNFEQRNVHRSKDMKDPNEYSVLVEAYTDFFEILRIALKECQCCSTQGRIERAAFLVIVDPATPCYVHKGGPINRVIGYLGKHGLTPDIKNDKSKFPVYQKLSGLRLTHYRNVTRDLIGASRGTARDPGKTVPPGQATRKDAVYILDLTQSILLLGSKATPDAKLSLALVARVAWLRWVYEAILAKSGPGAPKYWDGVDTRFADMRKQKKRVFGRFLNDDFALYGTVFVEDLTPVSPINMDDDE